MVQVAFVRPLVWGLRMLIRRSSVTRFTGAGACGEPSRRNGGREPDPDPGALPRCGLERGLAAVCLRDGRDDGQAQPASSAAVARRAVRGHAAGAARTIARLAVPRLPAGPFDPPVEA